MPVRFNQLREKELGTMEFNIHAIEAGEVKIRRTMFDRFDVFKVYGNDQKGASFEVKIFLDKGQDIEQAVYQVGGDLNVKIENQNAIDGKPLDSTG